MTDTTIRENTKATLTCFTEKRQAFRFLHVQFKYEVKILRYFVANWSGRRIIATRSRHYCTCLPNNV